MKKLKQVLIIINFNMLVITALAVASTYLCRRFDLTASFPLTLIATAVIFPIVFSIGGAYKRRENALVKYGSIKAHGRAIFFATRDWLENTDSDVQEKAKSLLGDLLKACRKLFAASIADMQEHEEEVYAILSRLSAFIKVDLRGKGLPSGEASRCNQFLSKMMLAF